VTHIFDEQSKLIDDDGHDIDRDHPLPIDLDGICPDDIDLTYSDIGSFDGIASDFFYNLQSSNTASGSTRPKTLTIQLKRPITTSSVTMGTKTGAFSNVKVEIGNAYGGIFATVDESASNTQYTYRSYNVAPLAFSRVKISFYTVNEIKIGFIYCPKVIHTSAMINGLDEDTGILTPISTSAGDFNVLARLRNATGNTKINPASSDNQTLLLNELKLKADLTETQPVEIKSGTAVTGGVKFVDESGALYGVRNADNKPRVSCMPYTYDVAEGNIPNHTAFNKYAINDDIDSANEEDVWCVGGSYVWPTVGQQMEVVSSSAEDDPVKADLSAGTGIHSIRIYYLDTLFAEKTTDVTLNGTAVVLTTATDIYRINRVRPLIVGSGLKAAGNIDIRNTSDTPIYSRIAAGFTKGRQLIYTVPAGKTLYINKFTGSIGGTTAPKYGRFTIKSTWDDISLTRNAWMTAYGESGQSSGFFAVEYLCPIKFPAGSDIVVSCKTLDDNCYVTASLRGWQE